MNNTEHFSVSVQDDFKDIGEVLEQGSNRKAYITNAVYSTLPPLKSWASLSRNPRCRTLIKTRGSAIRVSFITTLTIFGRRRLSQERARTSRLRLKAIRQSLKLAEL